MTTAAQWTDQIMGRLTLEEKIGQLVVFGFCGPVITPDVLELIDRYQVGGLRVTTKFRGMSMISDLPPGESLPAFKERSFRYPSGLHRDFAHYSPPIACTPVQYARTLKTLRDRSRARRSGVPIHFAFDQEGNAVDDMVNGIHLFPHPMAYAAAGDEALCYRCALALAKQCRAMGLNMIHSPVLDVNVNPDNPEVGTRSYSDDPDAVIRYAKATLRGLTEGGLTATGKHFPGRGDSASDAHHGLPAVDCDAATMRQVHLRPFQELIDAGLPAIMAAHSLYPALGATDAPASADPRVIKELLRGELGFQGVVETDNMMMGGILQNYTLAEAVVKVLQAGCDLILLREEGPARLDVLAAIKQAVESGAYPESDLDASVQRILNMRHAMGLDDQANDPDPGAAQEPVDDKATIEAAVEIAERSALVLRDRAGLLSVAKDARVLLAEQVFPAHLHANNVYSHPGLFWEMLSEQSDWVSCVEVPYLPAPADVERVKRRLAEEPFDLVITTSYYYHKDGPGGGAVLDAALASGKPVITLTNSPYKFAVRDQLDTVITVFHPGAPEHLRAAARIIYGQLQATGSLPVRLA